jgi:hypothetical protein
LPVKADEITVTGLTVGPNLKTSAGYPAVLSYTATGNPKIVNACFLWSGEGPYCFGTRDDRKAGKATTKLRTRNPNQYTLEGYIQYLDNGNSRNSNRGFATIIVTR